MKLVAKIIKEQDSIFLLYSNGECDVKENFDYDSIEKIIDFAMENDVKDFSVEPNEECSQYVLLLQNIFEKIQTDDFRKCYIDTKETDNESTSM